jgi:hypothetical protein
MTQLNITKIHISLKVKVSNELLEQHLVSSATVVGEALTESVLASVKKNSIGYFPALEYFQNQGDLDDDLMDAAETIGWFSSKIAREEVQNKMRPFFSTLHFQSVQTMAFTMPTVRPNKHNAHQSLIDHYTPNVVKLDIVASLLKKEQLKGIANWAKQLFRRNLENSFDEIEVIQAVVI